MNQKNCIPIFIDVCGINEAFYLALLNSILEFVRTRTFHGINLATNSVFNSILNAIHISHPFSKQNPQT